VTAPAVTPLPEIGVHAGVAAHTYRTWDAVNQSTLWSFRRSAAHARYEFIHPSESTHTQDLGSAIHAVLLEPDSVERDYAVRPADLPTRGPGSRKALWAWKEEIAATGKVILDKQDDLATLRGVRDAVRDHPLALEFLTAPGLTEVSALWRFDDTLCKARPDRIVEVAGWTWVVDVKSTPDASPGAFARSCVNFGYYLQAAFYLDGLEELAPRDRRFAFVAVEKTPPFGIAIYEPDIVFLEAGRDEYHRHLRTWRSCLESGRWPGYPTDIETLTAPQWFEKRLANVGVGD
jgi:hypothetical protein